MRARPSAAAAAALLLFSAAAAIAQPQTKEQRKCTLAMNGALLGIAKAVGKSISACIKDGSKESLPGTIESCLTADRGGKVGQAAADSDEQFTKRCTGTSKKDPAVPKRPPYGVTDAPTVPAAALEMALSIAHDVFGPDLDAAIVAAASDRDAAKCQQSVAKRASKCAAARLKVFNRCKGEGLKDEQAPFDGADDLAACLDVDPKGKIAKQCDLLEAGAGGKVDGIRKALDKKCAAKGVGLGATFPGCASADLAQTHACIDRAVKCRACLALDRADGLTRDCDLFDDGAANESCIPPFVIGQHLCPLTPDSGFVFETAMFFDTFALAGAVDIACGTVDPTTDRASCSCSLAQIDPIPIPGLGVACVRPAAGCPPGEISCAGGALYNSAITSRHNIGTCTGNADCAAQCAASCGSAAVFDSACEGFCRGGANAGAACMADSACPGGTCNGLNGAPHGSICQCECLDTGGDLSAAGGLHCNLGAAVDVETALPCGNGDVLFQIGERCVPFTTEATQAVIVDANNVSGEQIPSGVDIYAGLPLTCAQLVTDGPSGLALAARVNILDVDHAGDTALAFVLICE